MMTPPHKAGGIAIILGSGGPPRPMGGEEPAGDEDSMIPLPEGFDLGDKRPGDILTVQVECKVSPDGQGLIPLSVDGNKLGPDKDGPPPPPDDDDDIGDAWDQSFGKK